MLMMIVLMVIQQPQLSILGIVVFPMWVALFAPAKTPKPIVDRLAAEIAKAMQNPATKQRYADIKVDAVGSTPEGLDTFFREQLKFNEDVIKNAKIQQE